MVRVRPQSCPLVLYSHIPWDERGFKGRDGGEIPGTFTQ